MFDFSWKGQIIKNKVSWTKCFVDFYWNLFEKYNNPNLLIPCDFQFNFIFYCYSALTCISSFLTSDERALPDTIFKQQTSKSYKLSRGFYHYYYFNGANSNRGFSTDVGRLLPFKRVSSFTSFKSIWFTEPWASCTFTCRQDCNLSKVY